MLMMRKGCEFSVVRFVVISENQMTSRVLIVIGVSYPSELGVNVLEDMKLRPVD